VHSGWCGDPVDLDGTLEHLLAVMVRAPSGS
jgi:hypothetical protein